MKKITLIILSLIGLGCEREPKYKTTDAKFESIVVFSDEGALKYKIVEIDGVDYYASRTYQGHYVLGPKVEKP